ncbi:hypothetical protein V496_05578 [Pseudogymnoascus sp. VKM F-4515 (FW-2607)]|nr:hypothetical protein V496_05578 [Pseudogymnoascus sp. VKM F-4515 (FW-2607)]KFY86164.1 hypothetical protein V498_07583 [Pseudogymnoascus sp. VKM F-4517 (FW-2822)]
MTAAERRLLRRMALRFVLWDSAAALRMIYVENDGSRAWCIQQDGVEAELRVLHNLHGHFSSSILQKEVIGKAYWPTRFKDIDKYCKSCPQCQAVGPLRPSTGLNPIFELMPWDMFGMDFIGPIYPVSKRGNK